MSPLYLQNGKILIQNGALATSENCCCNDNCYRREVATGDPIDPICYQFACQNNIPEGGGWVKISTGCDNCGDNIVCADYTEWRIRDTADYLYAKGPVTQTQFGQELTDLPSAPFKPLFYDAPAGNRSFKLEALCSANNQWHVLEEWEGTITLCGATNDRYPTTNDRYPSRNLPGPWNLQKPCDKPRIGGIPLCNPPITCLQLIAGSIGDGQAWRDPDHTIAVTFTGAEDGEWTNLANWQDAAGRSPARYLPDSDSNVFINARLDNVPSDYDVTVNSLTINEGGDVYIEITTNNLLVYGRVGYISPCDEYRSKYGIITVNGNSCVFDGGVLEGTVYASNTTTYFNNNSYIRWESTFLCGGLLGNLIGDAEFNTGSYNAGEITGDVVVFNNNTYNACCGSNYNAQVGGGCIQANDVTFNGNSYNEGVIRTTHGVVTFKNTSANRADGLILGEGYGTVKFYDTSKNTGTGNGIGDVGHVYFYDSAYNDGYAAGSNVTFEDNSYNDGTVEYTTTNFTDDSINGKNNTNAEVKNNEINTSQANFSVRSKNKGKSFAETTFSGSAINDTTGSVSSFEVYFEGTSSNKGSVTIAENSAIFRNSSINDTAGTVNGNASFENTSRNKGSVTGTADFTLGGCNDGGTATTFIPDPPPVC